MYILFEQMTLVSLSMMGTMEEIPTLVWLLSSLKLTPREQLKKRVPCVSVKATSFALPSSAKPTLRTQSE